VTTVRYEARTSPTADQVAGFDQRRQGTRGGVLQAAVARSLTGSDSKRPGDLFALVTGPILLVRT
jgi:hypothetical protein